MAQSDQIPAWIALFLGLYWLSAATGELRSPNTWWALLKEFERSPGLRFLTGFVTFAFGAVLYLVSPWRTDDWLAIAISVIAGLHIAQGMLILASGDRFLRLARTLLGRAGRAWAGFAALAGIALVGVALSRLQAF